MNSDFYKLMLITQRENTPLNDYLDFIQRCISSGVTSVQLREKNSELYFQLQFARQLKKLLAPYHVPLIINDDVDLALQVDAHGVHLGQSDEAPQQARNRLGSNKFIGLSIESEEELKQANDLDINYIAASAVFPSQNKANLKVLWGIEGVRQLSKSAKHPLIGIGGITESNLAEVIQAGAQGVAVIGALHNTNAPAEMALKLRKIIDYRNA